ncbi:MAG TPA: hypothetical protein VJB14_16810 [Planctomycetota bacterium]|nr:hypothetical protein [Planctomycetota bacterium]
MKTVALLLACAAPVQDDFLPLREGARWTYAVEERAADAAETNRDVVTEVRGLRAIGETEWTEISDFLGYSTCFLRVTASGIDLKVEASDAAPVLTLLKRPLREGDTWKGTLGKEEVTFTTGPEERVELGDRVLKAVRVTFAISEPRKHQGHAATHGDLWFAAGLGIVKAQVTKDLDCHSGTTTVYRLKK